VDAKGRLAIPSEVRSRLDPQVHGSGLYLAPGPSDALWLWPAKTFEQMAAASEGSLLPDEDMLEFEELLYSQSTYVELDSAGRIRIPERLLNMAQLESSVVLLGVKDHLELRDPQRWATQRDERLEKQADIMIRARAAMQRRGQTREGH
jgi:MraZ protein